MRDCQDNHGKCRDQGGYSRDLRDGGVSSNSEDWIHGMKLVDCLTRTIVKAKSHHKYVALSYVWGTLPPPSLGDLISARIPNQLPRIIEDAITVTKKLNLRYLWVDRYCISTDDNVKHHQILNMDSVYGQAEVTLVLASRDTSEGIHGVSVPRTPQPRVRLDKVKLRSSLQDPKETVRRSTWNSRGWTYQEALLSRRRLMFTEDQIVFDCSQLWISEGVPGNQFERGVETVSSAMPRPQFSVFQESEPWKNRVETYTQRKFTFQTDRLNGFLGILKAFSKLDPPLYHIWGTPLHAFTSDPKNVSPRGKFLSNLCWDVLRPAQRLENFPSWCWTGWVGPIRFNLPHRVLMDVDISIELTDGEVLAWDEAIQLITGHDAPGLSTRLHLHVWTVAVRFIPRYRDGLIDGHRSYVVNTAPEVRLSLTLLADSLDALDHRLSTEKWICIVLSRTEGGQVEYAIVVDFDQDVAYRIGYLKFGNQHTKLEEVKRKMILG